MIQPNIPFETWSSNKKLIEWVKEQIELCAPDKVHLCDGSEEEFITLSREMIAQKKAIQLNPKLRPNSLYFTSDPDDVARVEESTFICSTTREEAGPTNNWKDPQEMKAHLKKLFSGCMKGRTMYVIPYSMGPLNSSLSHIGIEVTDSSYVVLNMKMMTRIGIKVLEALKDGPFVPGVHSVGVPLKKDQQDVRWPCNPKQRVIAHFPEDPSIYSYGSGYGGNALLGKKCFALRIASSMAKKEGWLAEHMLILGITSPEGVKKYIAAAFPSACGKTNLAMLSSTLDGWKVECVGDDIAWMNFKDGKLYAVNPEFGFFGVAPGTSEKTSPNAMACLEKNCIFTNVALTKDRDVWWEQMTDTVPDGLTDWLGNPYDKTSGKPAAHPNSRFTAPAAQCPIIDPEWENPEGVPISAIIFGGRRRSLVPLVYQAFSWQHGVYIGATVSSERTAAAKGTVGEIRHDPFAMLPFCGYNMGEYFSHWLEMGKKTDLENLPDVFHVNWFKKDENERFIWPGFGENIRVLKWIFERVNGIDNSVNSPIGILPQAHSLDVTGLSMGPEDLSKLFFIDNELWLKEVDMIEKYFTLFGSFLPEELKKELEDLRKRLL